MICHREVYTSQPDAEAVSAVHTSADALSPVEVVEVQHLLVVVEDDNHVLVKESSMVHGLIGHATSDGSITNHSHTVVLATLQAHCCTVSCCNPFKHFDDNKMVTIVYIKRTMHEDLPIPGAWPTC